MEWYGVAAIILIPFLVLVGARLFRVIRWGASLKREIKGLKERQKEEEGCRAKAIGVVISRCESLLKNPFPDLPTEASLKEFWLDVAQAAHPEARRPELKVSIGHAITTLNRSVYRFDSLLKRPGIWRLRGLRIKTLRVQSRRIRKVVEFAPVKAYFRFQKWVAGVNVLRLLLIPDPISWLIYLSGNLSLMVLSKCLLVDLTLFIGETALDFYTPVLVETPEANEVPEEELESLFEELGDLEESISQVAKDPALAPFRKRVTGLSALLSPIPDFSLFFKTLAESAEVVAGKHFPESREPLEELRVGPILDGTRKLLSNLGKGESIPVAGKIYNLRLDTLESIKRFTDETIPGRLKELFSKGRAAYSWLKWPLMAWRLTSKGGIIKVAAGVGWRTAGKGVTLYLYGRVYDFSLQELDRVCQLSKADRG